ncbi:MAG: hypothetical protein JM58_18965 [Peptococcaceae bacterium BICA1-8]|nr:MAG: hypothetical protein JM58_18965 [Peptococcaceae bacterium BICA1-8]
MKRKEVVEEIFLILAEFYKYPTEDFYNNIISSDVDKQLAKLFKAVNYELDTPQFTFWVGDFKGLRAEYSRSFLGITAPFAVPVESVYKVWTNDTSFQIPIANSKGYVMGDSALHILHLFEHFQLQIPEEYAQMPDHLTILLELYAFMIKERSLEECKAFLKDHFDWLGDFEEALSKTNEVKFYLYVVDVLKKVIKEEEKYLEKQ